MVYLVVGGLVNFSNILKPVTMYKYMHACSSITNAYYVASLACLYCRCSHIKSMLWVGVGLVIKLIMKRSHKETCFEQQLLSGHAIVP